MINISAVSYLNTLPLIYGLNNSSLSEIINLNLDYPSICAEKFLSGKADIALVPIVVMKEIDSYNIISNYCIGSDGYVDTVCLYSDVPIHQVKNIFLDYQSKTSVELLKILLKEYWNISPKIIDSKFGFENNIKGKNAGLVIGDRSFLLNHKFKFVYDLSFYWKKMTGLPFVFAVWLSKIEFSDKFIKDFNNALSYGLKNINLALEKKENNFLECSNPYKYLKNKISYNLDDKKIESMQFFLNKL